MIIEISQDPILFSRAVSTLQPEIKLMENAAYLEVCLKECQKGCPINQPASPPILCKRINLIKAMAKTMDQTELDARKWAEILRLGLCRPELY